MEATMQIFEELERREIKAAKELEEEADEYREHLEYQHLQIDEVVHEEEAKSSKREKGDSNTKYILETFDPDIEEELARRLKDVERK